MRYLLTLLFVAIALCGSATRAEAVPTFCAGGSNGADNGGSTSSVSWSLNATASCGASDYMLFVALTGDTSTDDVSGCTFAAVSMTLVGKAQATGGRWHYLFKLASPTSGSQTIACSAGSSHWLFGTAASFSGVGSTGATATDATSSVQPSLTEPLTTTQDNSIVIASGEGSTGVTTPTDATIRGSYAPFGSPQIVASATVTPIGSQSITINAQSGNGALVMILVELKEPGGGGGSGAPNRGLLGVGK